MSTEVRVLLGRAITRLLAGDKAEFERLAVKAEDRHKKERHLYVTVEEILKNKIMG